MSQKSSQWVIPLKFLYQGRYRKTKQWIPDFLAFQVYVLCMTIDNFEHLSHCRTIGKASSEIRLYFAAPSVHFVSDMSKNVLACHGDGDINCQVNKRASYISGQTIYGGALLANIGYTRRDSELHTEDVNLCTYYRYQPCWIFHYDNQWK